MVLVRWC